jgi:hypothetical protein
MSDCAHLGIQAIPFKNTHHIRVLDPAFSFPDLRPTSDGMPIMPHRTTKQMYMIRHDNVSPDFPIPVFQPCRDKRPMGKFIVQQGESLPNTYGDKQNDRVIPSILWWIVCRMLSFCEAFIHFCSLNYILKA